MASAFCSAWITTTQEVLRPIKSMEPQFSHRAGLYYHLRRCRAPVKL